MDAAYWIWLQMGLGIASPAAQQVLGHRIDPRTLYRMSLEQMVQQEIFSAAVCARLRSVSLSAAQRIARDCMHKGYQIIALTDSAIPVSCTVCLTLRWFCMHRVTPLCSTSSTSCQP